jgi:hypothetical protein
MVYGGVRRLLFPSFDVRSGIPLQIYASRSEVVRPKRAMLLSAETVDVGEKTNFHVEAL